MFTTSGSRSGRKNPATDNAEAAQDAVGGILTNSATINLTYSDSTPSITASLVTPVTVANGGTGAATLTGLLQGNGVGAVTVVTNSTTVGQVLRVTGSNTYAWGTVDLADTDAITGDLPLANLTQGSARSVLGVTGNATADVASMVGTASQFLVVNSGGTALAFTTMSGDATLSGGAIVIGANKVTNAILRQSSGLSVIGRSASTTGDVADITGTASQILKVNTAGTSLGFESLATAGIVGGSGTQNFLPKWNNVGGTTLGNSLFSDDGANNATFHGTELAASSPAILTGFDEIRTLTVRAILNPLDFETDNLAGSPVERVAIEGGVDDATWFFEQSKLNLGVLTGGGAAEFQFVAPSSSGRYSAFKAQAQASTITYTLPATDAAGALTSNGSGSLTWVAYQPLDSDLTSWAGVTRAAGFDTFAATPTSANLDSLVTDDTGSGALVFANTPTLVTPVLGAATATSINGLTITSSTGTLTIANGKTFTVNHSLTLAGTDSTTMTFPTTTATIARTDAGQTFTGTQTVLAAATQDAIALKGRAGGTGSFIGNLTPTTLSASRTYTFKDADGTVAFTSDLPVGANPTGTIGVAAVNGSAATFLRSDGAPAFDMAITRNWTAGVHTFAVQDVHTLGIDLSTSGRVNSQVADAPAAKSIVLKPNVALTSNTDRWTHTMEDSAGNVRFSIASNGAISMFAEAATLNGLVNISGTAATTMTLGLVFTPTWSATSGGSILGITDAYIGTYSAPNDASALPATSNLIGAFYTTTNVQSGHAHAAVYGAIFKGIGTWSGSTTQTHTAAYGWRTLGHAGAKNQTLTNAYGGYVDNQLTATGWVITNDYGIYIEEQTRGATLNNGLFLANATDGRKLIVMRDQDVWLGSNTTGELSFNGTTFNILFIDNEIVSYEDDMVVY